MIGNRRYKFDDPLAGFGLVDARKSPVQLQAFGSRKKIHNILRRRAVRETVARGAGVRLVRRILEKKRGRHIQESGYLLQSAGADPIHAFFVFLDLLECDPERFAELLLAHIHEDSLHPNAIADMSINRIRRLVHGYSRFHKLKF